MSPPPKAAYRRWTASILGSDVGWLSSVMSETINATGGWWHRENSPSTVAAVGDDVTLVEIAALLAVAQDHAFGQPPGSQLRATALGQHLAKAVATDSGEHATTWWTSTLRFLGCTGHSVRLAVRV